MSDRKTYNSGRSGKSPNLVNHRGDRGDSSAQPRLLRAPPAASAPPSYYAGHTERETQLFGIPTNAEETCSSPGAGRETDK